MPPGKRRSKQSSSLFVSEDKDESSIRPDKKIRLDPELENMLDKSSLLSQSLARAGLLVKTGEEPNVLQEDQAIFLKKFVKDISTELNFPENINIMFGTLSSWLEDDLFLKKCLSPTMTSAKCTTARSNLQDNLIRLLLNTAQVQPKLLPLLLEKLAEVSLMEEGKESICQSNIPRMILSAVRWLDKIVHPEGLADKMIEILGATSRYQQVEVISALPEIIPDNQHPAIVECLREMLDSRQPLVSPLLDCFTNLHLSPEIVSDLRHTVLKKLPGAAQDELPNMVEFILTTVTRDNANIVIQELRDSLDLSERLLRPSQRPGPDKGKKRLEENGQTVERILLDKIGRMSSRDKWAAEAWLAAIQSVVEDQKSTDLMVLLVLYRSNKRVVESLVRNKVRAGIFNQHLVEEVFKLHISSLKNQFHSLMDLSEVLLQSSEGVVVEFSRQLYCQAFSNLGGFCQQDIVGDLVSKVGTGGGGDVTKGALSVLSQLSEERCDQLSKYGTLIMGVLDFMQGLSLNQVRTVITILATLAWGTVGGVSLQDDLVIVVKKQINSSTLSLQRMGVIGCVSVMRAMSVTLSGLQTDQPQAESSRLSAGGPGLGEVLDLMRFVRERTRYCPETAGLFLDQLSSMISISRTQINEKMLDDLTEKSTEEFQEEYIENVETFTLSLETSTEYMLDDPDQDSEDDPIALPLAPFVMRATSGTEGNTQGSRLDTRASRLLPSFRLLSVSVRSKGEIDALLGCGLTVFPESVLAKLSQLTIYEKNAVCSTLFYTANWLVELVNCFSDSSDEDDSYKNKVLIRIKQLLQLRQQISRCLNLHHTFRPPNVLFSEDTSDWSPPDIKDKVKKGEKGKGKGKGKKTIEPGDRTLNATLNLNSQRTQCVSQSVTDNITNMDIKHYRPFFRELDISCLSLLGYQDITTETEPQMSEEIQQPKFRPAELLFLLEDLVTKLEFCLVSGKVRSLPGKVNVLASVGFTNISSLSPRVLVETVSPHLGHIFSHLDEVANYFKRLISVSDGVVDSIDMLDPRTKMFSDCLKYGFKAVNILFSWTGFQSSSLSPLLQASLVQIASRVTADLTPATPLARLVSITAEYLVKFSDYIQTIDVATTHLELVSTVVHLNGHDKLTAIVSSLASTYISRGWSGPDLNKHVEKVVSQLLSHSEAPLDIMGGLIKDGVEPVVGEKGGISNIYPVVTRSTVGGLYRVVLTQLVQTVRKVKFGVTKDHMVQLAVWTKAVATLSNLTNCLKKWQNRLMLGAVLKYSRFFLDHFIRHGMPLVEQLFRKRREDCIELIKDLQHSTRYLQSVCSHSKLMRDVSLSNNCPQLKKSLEVLVYRAKAMLAANDCIEAFVFGNLKNKDLNGAVIMSQEAEEAEEEEEQNEEGEESDVEIGVDGGDDAGESEEGSVMSDVY